jgi:hypothetical protein
MRLREQELAARADQLCTLADTAIDLSYARSLRQRASDWRALAAELRVLDSDPLYRQIHDRP